MIDSVLAFSEIVDHNQLVLTSVETEMRKNIPFLPDHLWKTFAISSHFGILTQQILDNLSLSLHEVFPLERSPPPQSLVQHRADFAAYLLEFKKIRLNRPGRVS